MEIGVVGSGQMGSGIAQVAAQNGFSVILCDTNENFLERGLKTIKNSLGKLSEKGKLNEDSQIIANRIKTTCSLNDLNTVDIIIEAITEEENTKLNLFKKLSEIAKPETIFASNTSSIPITKLASTSKRADRFIGMHFMNPVPLMPLVEVIRGHLTSEETTETVVELAKRFGKTPIEVNDYPGFISNRILMPMINEAIQCVMEGVAKPEAIDSIMKLGMNHPMGPLTLADFIGLDTCLAIMEVLHQGLGDDKYRPSPLLRKMVQAGLFGRKNGQGFYKY